MSPCTCPDCGEDYDGGYGYVHVCDERSLSPFASKLVKELRARQTALEALLTEAAELHLKSLQSIPLNWQDHSGDLARERDFQARMRSALNPKEV